MSTFLRHVPLLLGLLAPSAGCLAGEVRERYASAVDQYLATPFVGAEEAFADPARALGPPDGRTLALGVGASITLRFFRDVLNGPGPDVRVYEVGPDDAEARVALSDDGVTFTELAPAASGPSTEIELDEAGLERARYVRVRGMDNQGIEPGFDLDAVEALH